VAAGELQEVVGLHDHVVELEQGERLLALQAEAHRVEGEHPVDREVGAEVAQERDVAQLDSHASLSTRRAPPSRKSRKRPSERRMPALFASSASSVSSRRVSSLPEGSPTFVVPPPTRAIGRWPVRWSVRSSMIETRLPTWRLSAVQSKPT
jgi:hypothetical protein